MRVLAVEVRAGRILADQLIVYERGGFLHVSHRASNNRRELLRSAASGGSGGPYSGWVG